MKKRFDWLQILLFFLGGLLAVLVFFAVIIIAFPVTGERAVANFRDSFEHAIGYDPQEKATEFFLAIGTRARAGWEKRIVQIPKKLSSIGKKVESKSVRQLDEEKLTVEFNECGKCHKDYMERSVFKGIYMNHRKHFAQNVKCYDCHKENTHPNPQKVQEEDCKSCHKKNGDIKLVGECSACHTPGSIFNDVRGDTISTQKFLASRKVNSLMPSGFQHGKTEACKNCHETPEFCNKCHLVFHDKLPDWLQIHGPNILASKYQVAGCRQCHKQTWCATKCHKNPGRSRMEGNRELPRIPIDSYIR